MSDTPQQYPLGYLYAGRMWGHERVLQATSRSHDGCIHCRVYAPGTDWHGRPTWFYPGDLGAFRKLDLPIPADGWSIVRMVEPGEKV